MDPYRSPENSTPARVQPAAPARVLRRSFNPYLRLAFILIAFTAVIVGAGAHLAIPPFAIAIGVVTLLSGYGLLLVYYRRIAMRLARENNEGNALLAAGRLDEAITLYDGLARRAGRMHSLRALFWTNLGLALLRRGEPDRALEYLGSAQQSGWLERSKLLPNYTVLLSAMATAHFSRGDIEVAREWHERARKSVPDARRGMLVLGDALLGARTGDYANVDTLTAAQWSDAEGSTQPFQMRLLRLVRAFALTQLPDSASRVDEVTALVAGAKPSRPGEFDYIARTWPAFRAFLVERQFSAG